MAAFSNTDREKLIQAQMGMVASAGLTDPEGTVKAANRRQHEFAITDGGTAGTAVTETAKPVIRKGKVIAAYITCPVAVGTHAANYDTFTLAKRTAAGGATTIGTFTTNSSGGAALAQFVPSAMTLTAAAVNLAAGDVLTVAVAKASSGTAIAAATSNAFITVDVEEN